MTKELFYTSYRGKKRYIEAKLKQFAALPEHAWFDEFLFCLLTPASNAHRCWEAVEQLKKIKKPTQESVALVLKSRVRFHNVKAARIMKAHIIWSSVKKQLATADRIRLRNWLAETVSGYGLKEASHFLRNIGKSDNQLAILDRHILRNLHALNIIDIDTLKGRAHYLAVEQKFLSLARETSIPPDHLDLVFWSKETGEIFK